MAPVPYIGPERRDGPVDRRGGPVERRRVACAVPMYCDHRAHQRRQVRGGRRRGDVLREQLRARQGNQETNR